MQYVEDVKRLQASKQTVHSLELPFDEGRFSDMRVANSAEMAGVAGVGR